VVTIVVASVQLIRAPELKPRRVGPANCVLAACDAIGAPWRCSRSDYATRRSFKSCVTNSPRSHANKYRSLARAGQRPRVSTIATGRAFARSHRWTDVPLCCSLQADDIQVCPPCPHPVRTTTKRCRISRPRPRRRSRQPSGNDADSLAGELADQRPMAAARMTSHLPRESPASRRWAASSSSIWSEPTRSLRTASSSWPGAMSTI
jgi:hypothetical protein